MEIAVGWHSDLQSVPFSQAATVSPADPFSTFAPTLTRLSAADLVHPALLSLPPADSGRLRTAPPAAERGAKLKVVPVDSRGQLRLDEMQRLLNSRTKMVSIIHVSNALGTVTPIQEIVDLGHRAGACMPIDCAQSVSHLPINVQSLDADFFVLSGHRVFGPTGIGVLYGKAERLEDMPPWQGGGNMIEDVTFERTTHQPPPGRFEAGTGKAAASPVSMRESRSLSGRCSNWLLTSIEDVCSTVNSSR